MTTKFLELTIHYLANAGTTVGCTNGKCWRNKDANTKVELPKETLNLMIDTCLGHRKCLKHHKDNSVDNLLQTQWKKGLNEVII